MTSCTFLKSKNKLITLINTIIPTNTSIIPQTTWRSSFVEMINMAKAVRVQIIIVVTKVPNIPKNPCSAGWSTSADACIIPAIPFPASFENKPLATPNLKAYIIV